MSNLLCHSVIWESLGNLGVWGWIGLILGLIFWVGSIATLTALVVWAIQRARVPAATVLSGTEKPTAQEL